MFNKVILVGNLTKDIELRYTPGGAAIAKCGIATSRKWKDQSGQQKEETLFIDFTVWGRSAEVVNQYLHKGSKVLLEGRLTLEQWTDQSGQKRSRHTITVENFKMLDGRQDQASQPPQQPTTQSAPAQQPPETNIDIDDEIPF
ncbi:single-stranded DNA-binding protein [Hydrogenimonas sp.]